MTNNLPIAPQNPSMTRAIPDSTLVVFDERVSDIEILSQALLPGSIGFTIRTQADGLETITDLLAITGAKYLAIVAHGEPGVVHLGKNSIDLAQIQAQSHLLQSWGVTEIALYSCQVAQDDIGKDLIYQLSELTGATVAAAATKTGSATLGGNWDLAVTTGNITAPMLFESSILETYQSVLASIGLVAGTKPIEGGLLGTFDIILDTPSATGLVVGFNTTGTTATPNIDYTLSPGIGITALTANTFTIAAGVTKATINVVANRDAIIDPNEIIKINTASVSGGYVIGEFIPQTNFEVGSFPTSVAKGDFNGDRILDLVAANHGSSSTSVSVLLGTGSGGFSAKTDFTVGTQPIAVTVGDFNDDGKLDLATTSDVYNTVSILLGDGSGGFSAKTDFTFSGQLSGGPVALAVGDFNGDSKLDLFTANSTGSGVSVLLGDGAGGISAETGFAVGNNPRSVIVGDFNGDRNLDLVVANQNYNTNNNGRVSGLSVLLGDGVGGIISTTNIAVPGGPDSIVFGYFNNDNNFDLATANYDGNTVSILLGDRAGGFALTTTVATGNKPMSIKAGDFNGDGTLDLATALFGSRSVSVVLGDGAGRLTDRTDIAMPVIGQGFFAGSPTSVTVGDFNNDGKIDLATAVYDNNVSVLLNNYDRTASLSIVDNPTRNDFNNDNKSDILWRNDNGAIALWQMNGATVTPNLTSFPSRETSWKVAGTGDFNADGKSDILWRNDSGAIDIWTMNGAYVNSFSATSTPSLDPKWETVGTGDFTGDGKTDILWRNTNLNDNRVVLWTMDGSNVVSSQLTSTPTLDKSWKAAGTGDFNGDGKSDILWRNDDGSIALWQMNGTNVSSKLTSTPRLDNSWKINGTADFSGDGKFDILWRKDTGEIAIWTMDGTNVVSSQLTSTPSLDNSWQIKGTGDFNGDGKADILWRKDNGITDPTTDIVAVWTMDGTNILSSTLTSVQPESKAWKVAAPIF
jgi:Domain of unknown function (DUF4347)/FG-GAP-like repeat